MGEIERPDSGGRFAKGMPPVSDLSTDGMLAAGRHLWGYQTFRGGHSPLQARLQYRRTGDDFSSIALAAIKDSRLDLDQKFAASTFDTCRDLPRSEKSYLIRTARIGPRWRGREDRRRVPVQGNCQLPFNLQQASQSQ